MFDASPLSVVYSRYFKNIFLLFLLGIFLEKWKILVKYVFENTGCSSIFAYSQTHANVAIFINVTIQ